MIGAVLTWTDTGHRGACGQTVGADGAGVYAVVFHACTAEEASEAARQYVREKLSHLVRIRSITVVTAEEQYGGSHIMEVEC